MSPGKQRTYSRRFVSETGELESVRSFVEDAARDFGFSEAEIANIVLAVDEACTNIIKHAYEGRPDGTINVDIQRHGTSFSVRIQDKGKPFDPNAIHPPDLRKHLSEFRRGGLGVYLMRRMMDRVEYAIQPGRLNEVVLTKFLTSSPENRS